MTVALVADVDRRALEAAVPDIGELRQGQALGRRRRQGMLAITHRPQRCRRTMSTAIASRIASPNWLLQGFAAIAGEPRGR